MEVSEVSTALQSSSVLTARHSAGVTKAHECECDDQKVSRDRHHGYEMGRGAAIQALRAELRMSLKAKFHAEFGSNLSGYAAHQEPASSDDVADEALGVAKNIVEQSPTTAAKAMIQFRSSVEQSVQIASKTVQSAADQADLDNATAKIDEGITQLEDAAASTVTSSTKVLDVDSETQQSSTIRIRTQEGDIVRLSLRQKTDFEASSIESVDGDSSSNSTEIDFSSQSRMVVKVRGDLNEAEMGAIESVLAQAQEMADSFFGGDISAAFASASGFEFDTEQLSRVKMRFRMEQETQVNYSEVTNTVVTPRIEAPEHTAQPAHIASMPEKIETATPAAEAAVIPDEAIQGFFEMVGSFLRSVSEGFVESTGSATIRYQHSESFKLSLLQSVINTVAPDDASEAADTAVGLIDQISASE